MFKYVHTIRKPLLSVAFSNTANSPVHATAIKGFNADSAVLYNSGRPSYTKQSIDKISSIICNSGLSREEIFLLELGSGTGKFTKSFLEYFKLNRTDDKLHYTATEPSDGFRETLAKELSSYKVEVANAIGTNIPVKSESLDAILVAQAFHWMATTSTLKEIHRVLKPNSPLIMIWNTYDYSHDWLKVIETDILNPAYGTEIPRQQDNKWKECFYAPGMISVNENDGNSKMKTPLFSPMKSWYGENKHYGDEQLVVDRFMSTSVIAERSEAERTVIEERLRHILATHPDLRESRETNKFCINYITELVWVTRNG